jgi:hypothetical protein
MENNTNVKYELRVYLLNLPCRLLNNGVSKRYYTFNWITINDKCEVTWKQSWPITKYTPICLKRLAKTTEILVRFVGVATKARNEQNLKLCPWNQFACLRALRFSKFCTRI